jgi:DNA polymerase III subunit delta'
LAQPSIESALKTADRLQKTPVVDLVAWGQRWLYDLLSVKYSGRIRYYPRYRKELSGLAEQVDGAALLRVLKALNDRRAIAEHPLSAKLFIEDMLLDYSRLFS